MLIIYIVAGAFLLGGAILLGLNLVEHSSRRRIF